MPKLRLPHQTHRWVAALVALGASLVSLQSSSSIGPLFDNFPLTLQPGDRTEILGPIFHSQTAETEKQWAIHPLISRTEDQSLEYLEWDFLYPLLSYDQFGQEYRFHIFQLFNFSGGGDVEGTNRHRFSLFPFYFQQRSKNPDYNYTALFPFYGTLKNRLFKDEIKFVAFPLYVRTEKKGVTTWNAPYPIFHIRRGEELTGWQVWPLAGHETKDHTFKTDSFGDPELVPGHRKLFILWPIFFEQRLGLGTTNPVAHHVLFPAYVLERSPLRDSSTYLWPLFTYTDDRGKKYREWGAPWPFVVVARGEGKTATRVWPLFGHAHNKHLRSDFILWPVYKMNALHAPPAKRRRTRILLFLYSDIVLENTETKTRQIRRDQWPLFTYKKEHDGRERLQVLALLEPLLPNNKSIERNYSPLWSVWRSEKNPRTGKSSQSLLWNLYRRDKSPEQTKTSALFGLVQRQRSPEEKGWRLFYFPLGRRPATIPAETAEAH